jgi:hypothetical protein
LNELIEQGKAMKHDYKLCKSREKAMERLKVLEMKRPWVRFEDAQINEKRAIEAMKTAQEEYRKFKETFTHERVIRELEEKHRELEREITKHQSKIKQKEVALKNIIDKLDKEVDRVFSSLFFKEKKCIN